MPDAKQTAEDHYYAALDLYADGKAEAAIVEYQAAVDADPTLLDALHGLARVYQDLSRFDEAIEVAKKISEHDPDDVLAHTSLSILYQKKGMIAEAEEEANQARILGWKQQLKEGK
jgi:tetratricopeptide (TPR) repeat protein